MNFIKRHPKMSSLFKAANLKSKQWHCIAAAIVLPFLAFPTTCNAQLESVSVTPDVVYGHKDGMALTFDVFRPKENGNGVGVLFMVSGGWVSTWMEPKQSIPMFKHLLAKGYTVIAVRHGSSPRYVVPECVSDVQLALSFIAKHAADWQIDPKRLGVFGFSAGGHLSLMLGTVGGTKRGTDEIARVAAVVAVFPPTDLAPYVDPKSPLREQFPALKFEPSRAESFSPLMQVTADDAPTLLYHGDKDELVPLWHSEKIQKAFDAVKVANNLVVIKDAAHGFNEEGNRRLANDMVEWFDRHLIGLAKQ
jgi:acetyl esterase/lipase